MARLINLQTNQVEEVADDIVNFAIADGTHGFIRGFEVPVLELDSDRTGTLPPEEAVKEILNGRYSYIGDKEIVRRGLELKYGGAGQKAIGLTEQFASGMTMGLSELAEKAAGVDPADIAGRKEVTGLPGDVANIAGTLMGLKVKGSPVNLLDRAGMGVEKGVKPLLDKTFRDQFTKKATSLAIRGGFEGGAFSTSNYLKETALGNTEFNAEALRNEAISGMKTGAILLGGAATGYKMAEKTARQFKALMKTSNRLKKFAGVKSSDKGMRLNIKGKDLRTKEMSSHISGKGASFKYDPETNLYKYEDGVKEVHLDPVKIEGKILSISDVNELDKIGAKLEIPSLSEKIAKEYDPSKQGFAEFLVMQRQGVYENMAESLFDLQEKGVKVIKNYENLKKGWRKIRSEIQELEAKPQTPVIKKKIAQKRKKLGQLQRNIKGQVQRVRRFESIDPSKVSAGSVVKRGLNHSAKDVDNVLAEYSAFKFGDNLFIKNLNSVDNAIHSSVSKGAIAKAKRDISFGDIKTLKLAGAGKRHFRNKTDEQIKELAKFIRGNFRSSTNERLINHPAFTDLDDLINNVEITRLKAIDDMNNAIGRADQYLDSAGMSTNLTGAKIADYIDKNFYGKYLDPRTRKPLPGFEGIVKNIEEFSTAFRNMRRDSITGTQIPFKPSEFREIRIKMDKFPGLDFDKQQSISKELIKGTRNYMEDALIKQMSKFDEASDIVSTYKRGKKNYGLSQDTMGILENRFTQESANNAISLTGYISAGAGAGAFGLPGAIGGLAIREFSRAYGNNLLALYADDVFRAQNKLVSKISKSVKSFINAPTSRIRMPVIQKATEKSIEEMYQDDIREIESGKYNFEVFADEFIENNQAFMSAMPMIADGVQRMVQESYAMLMEKMPKNPYEGAYIRQFRPSDSEIRKFARYKRAILKPDTIYDEISAGNPSNESIEVLKRLHPASYKLMQFGVLEELSKRENTSFKKRAQLKRVFGVQTDHYQRPDNVMILQATGKNPRVNDEKQAQKARKAPKIVDESELTQGERMMGR